MIQDDPTGSPLKIVGDSGEHHQPRPLGTAESWRLKVSGAVARPGTFTLEELANLPGAGQSRALEITCVSAARIVHGGGPLTFGGLPFSALAAHVGAGPAPMIEFISRAPGTVGPRSRRHRTTLPWEDCVHPEGEVLLATRMEGEPLPYRHGGPLRSVPGPHLFFYKGIKWLEEIRFRTEPQEACRGTWEEHAGYHNRARVALNERFEPVLRRIVEVREDPEIPGGVEDVTEPVPQEEWQAVFDEMLGARNFSRLAAAQLHKGVGKMPQDLKGVVFSEGPYRAKIRGTSFAGCDLTGARMAGGNFSLSKLTNARFSDDGRDPADLTGGDFEGAYFNNAYLQGVPMRNAVLTNVTFFAEKDRDRPTDRVQGLDVRGAIHLSEANRQWLAANGALVD